MILSNADKCHRSGFAKNNGVKVFVVIHTGVIYICAIFFDLLAVSSRTFQKQYRDSLTAKITQVYINICQQQEQTCDFRTSPPSSNFECDKLAATCMLNSSNKQCYSARQVVITQCAGGFQRGQATVEGPCLLLPGAVNFCDRTSSAATTRLTTVSLQRRSRLLGRAHPQQTSPHHNTARSHCAEWHIVHAAKVHRGGAFTSLQQFHINLQLLYC